MTIIAYDGKTLACDSRYTAGSTIITDIGTKIYKLNDITYFGDVLRYIGMSGACADYDKVVSYLHSEDFPGGIIDHDVHALILGEQYIYKLEESASFLIRYSKKQKLTCGSGGKWASSAMSLGLTAMEAAKHAVKHDSACGGKIKHVTL